MFTPSTIKALKTYFKLAILLKAEPFEWINSPILGFLRVTNSKFNWLLLVLSFLWVSARSMWMVPNLIWQIIKEAPVKTSVINLIYTLFHIVVVTFQINTFRRREEIKEFINCLLHYNQYTPGKIISTRGKTLGFKNELNFNRAFPGKQVSPEKRWMRKSVVGIHIHFMQQFIGEHSVYIWKRLDEYSLLLLDASWNL